MENENETSSAQSEVAHERKKLNYPGPKPGVKYPLNVLYCGGKYAVLFTFFTHLS